MLFRSPKMVCVALWRLEKVYIQFCKVVCERYCGYRTFVKV